MTKIWYDTEFIEDGKTIELISVGMVREDGTELYMINSDPAVMAKAANHEWLRKNVMPHLPVLLDKHRAGIPPGGWAWEWEWDNSHPDITVAKPVWMIADAVKAFILDTQKPELRAWYAAYDHVRLMQLWGPMIKKPRGVPMWTFDLKQEAVRLGDPEVPAQDPATEHHALHDALHDMAIDAFLERTEHEIWDQWAR